MTQSNPPDIDLDALDRLRELMGVQAPLLLPTLVEQFAQQGPTLIADIQAGYASRDAPAVRLAAHTLKSNAANFGLETLREIARAIEQQAKQGDLTQVDAASAQAAVILDQAMPQLRQLVRPE